MGFNTQPALLSSGIAGAGKSFTAELWNDFDPQAMDRDPSLGVYYQDDFLSPPVFAANSAAASVSGRYNGATGATAGSTIGPVAGQGGVVELQSTTDNEAAILQFGGVAARPFMLTTAPEDDTYPYHHLARLRLETRFLLHPNVIADEQAIFIGMAGVVALTDLDNDTGDVVGSKNFFGFHTLNAAPSTLRFIYQAAADSAPQVLIASVATLEANKWYTAAIDYDPTAPADQRGKIWFNGAKNAIHLTQAQSEAATFPKSNDSTQVTLAPTWMRKSGDGTTTGLVLGSWRIAEEYKVKRGNEACG